MLCFASCGGHFRVEGTLTDAPSDAQYIYLDHLALGGAESIDSVKVRADGTFRFKAPSPASPDIYRLRCNGRTVLLAVDSVEKIGIDGSWADRMHVSFSGSVRSADIAALRCSLRDSSLSAHKNMAKGIVLRDPASQAAYYALFQTKDGAPVFNIYDPADRPYFQAVATAWHVWHPASERTTILYNQVLDVINNERRAVNNEAMRRFVDESENTFLDMTFDDENGIRRSLSDLRGKVILLDFCSSEMPGFGDYVFSMRERYNAYHAKGLEIYQVYADRNRLLWEDQVSNLPWVTVRPENGIADPVYRTYNVQSLPTMFLFNRKGEIMGRYVGFKDMNQLIEKLL